MDENLRTIIEYIKQRNQELDAETTEVVKNGHSWATIDHDVARIGGQKMAHLAILKVIAGILNVPVEAEECQSSTAERS